MILITYIFFMYMWVQVLMAHETLKLVHMIFRHCERIPDLAELYVKSPYYNESTYYPHGYGQLTNEGKRRCYENGRALRQRYNGFISSSYHYSLVEGRSTYFDRAKESLQLLLVGLFPPTEELMWLDGINWLPFATYYDRKESDKVLFPFKLERFEQEHRLFLQSKEGKAFLAPFKDLMENFAKHVEESEVDFERMAYIASGIQQVNALGLPLPDWIKPLYPKPILDGLSHYFTSLFGSKLLRRYMGGFLFKKIIEDTEMKINESSVNTKMYIYSAHDITILTFFTVLDIFNIPLPPVGCYCLLELHKINGTYGFKLLYYNSTSVDPYPMSIPGFGEFAPLDKLKMKKKEFLQLDDLYKESFATRQIASILCIFTLLSIVLQL